MVRQWRAAASGRGVPPRTPPACRLRPQWRAFVRIVQIGTKEKFKTSINVSFLLRLRIIDLHFGPSCSFACFSLPMLD